MARMTDIRWERYPSVAEAPNARTWLTFQAKLGLAPNTIEAYGRALEDFLRFSNSHGIGADGAKRVDIAEYVHDLLSRPSPRGNKVRVLDSGAAWPTPPFSSV